MPRTTRRITHLLLYSSTLLIAAIALHVLPLSLTAQEPPSSDWKPFDGEIFDRTWKRPENYDSVLAALDADALVYEVLSHPEAYVQACARYLKAPSLSLVRPVDSGENLKLSKRQIDALLRVRDSAVAIMATFDPTLFESKLLLQTVNSIKAIELVPQLIDVLERAPYDSAACADSARYPNWCPNADVASTIGMLLEANGYRVRSDVPALDGLAIQQYFSHTQGERNYRGGWTYGPAVERAILDFARDHLDRAESLRGSKPDLGIRNSGTVDR